MRNRFQLAYEVLRGKWSGPLLSSSPEIARALRDYGPTAAGISITEQTALNYSAVWRAVNYLAGQVSTVPLITYRQDGDSRQRALGSTIYRLLHNEPNPEMSSQTFREVLCAHVLTWGNGYAEIVRTRERGNVAALWPITPDRVTVTRRNDRLVYLVTQENGEQITIEPRDMIHVPGLGFDGTIGYSVVRMARESLGLLAAQERTGSAFFGNGMTFGGTLEHPGRIGKTAREDLLKDLEAKHQGSDRAHKWLLLQEGMKATRLGIPPHDAQFLETRKFSIIEVARWFGVQPHKLYDLERATFSNIEHQSIESVVDGVRPLCVRFEMEFNRKIMPAGMYAEHLLEGLMRGDTATRNQGYATGRQWGWLSADDVRRMENLNPLPNGAGAIYLQPSNMQNAQPERREAYEAALAAQHREITAEYEARGAALAIQVETGERRRREALEAQRAVVLEAIGRMVRRECERARQRGREPSELGAWMEAFYREHVERIVDVLAAAARTVITLTDDARDPAALVRELAADHCARSIARLHRARDEYERAGDGQGWGLALERALGDLERDQPARFTDALFLAARGA